MNAISQTMINFNLPTVKALLDRPDLMKRLGVTLALKNLMIELQNRSAVDYDHTIRLMKGESLDPILENPSIPDPQ